MLKGKKKSSYIFSNIVRTAENTNKKLDKKNENGIKEIYKKIQTEDMSSIITSEVWNLMKKEKSLTLLWNKKKIRKKVKNYLKFLKNKKESKSILEKLTHLIRTEYSNNKEKIRLEYDLEADRVLIDGKIPNKYEYKIIRRDLAYKSKLNFRLLDAMEAVESVALENSFSPSKDMLLHFWKKYGKKMDKKERKHLLENWLIDHAGADSTKIIKRMSKLWLIGAISRRLHPHVDDLVENWGLNVNGRELGKMDHSLVLIGKQGAGKGELLKRLCVDRKLYSASLDNFSSVKAVGEAICGKWIMEIPEGAARKKSSSEDFKKHLTMDEDNWRHIYTDGATETARRCVFVLTYNLGKFCIEPGVDGNRRLFPIILHKEEIDMRNFEKCVPRLLGAAVGHYLSGERWHIAPKDKAFKLLQQHQEQFYKIDKDHSLKKRVLESLKSCYVKDKGFQIKSIIRFLGFEHNVSLRNNIGSILREEGFERYSGSRNVQWWIEPKFVPQKWSWKGKVKYLLWEWVILGGFFSC